MAELTPEETVTITLEMDDDPEKDPETGEGLWGPRIADIHVYWWNEIDGFQENSGRTRLVTKMRKGSRWCRFIESPGWLPIASKSPSIASENINSTSISLSRAGSSFYQYLELTIVLMNPLSNYKVWIQSPTEIDPETGELKWELRNSISWSKPFPQFEANVRIESPGFVKYERSVYIATYRHFKYIALDEIKPIFTITSTVPDSRVYINGVRQNTIQVKYGSKIEWKVVKENYITQEGIIESLTENQNMSITLERDPNARFWVELVVNPINAKTYINGMEVRSYQAGYNEKVKLKATLFGYADYNEEITVTDTVNKQITLTPMQSKTFLNVDNVMKPAVLLRKSASNKWEAPKYIGANREGTGWK